MLGPLAAAAFQTGPSPPAPQVSSAVTAFVEATARAYAKVRADQARAQAKTDRKRLERLFDLDQAGREPLAKLDFEHLTVAERRVAQAGLDEIAAQDLVDQAQLRSMIPRSGWFTRKAYGRKAALGSWLVVDHATNDPALMRTVLARLKPLASAGGYEGRQYAIMYDRVALTFDHRSQRYGTQVTCQAGAWRALDVEAPAQLDRRRREVGFKETEAAYLKGFVDACH